jgi:hypothetical protein
MNNLILKLGILLFFSCFISFGTAYSQNGQVPELVDVVTATKLLSIEVKQLQDEILIVEQSGGTVEQNVKDRLKLYSEVNEVLKTNAVGLTTFLAVSGSCNYKALKNDDEAFHDLLNGLWDENMNELIKVLTK